MNSSKLIDQYDKVPNQYLQNQILYVLLNSWKKCLPFQKVKKRVWRFSPHPLNQHQEGPYYQGKINKILNSNSVKKNFMIVSGTL